MLDIPKVVCNDLNRILTINTVGLLIARIMNYSIDFNTWHITTLRDIGLISVYDQVIVRFHKNLLRYMKNNGIKFNGAIEELVENLVLLSLNKSTTPILLTTQILGVIIYHMYFTC